MRVIQVDRLNAEPLEAFVACLSDPFCVTPEAEVSQRQLDAAELRSDEDVIALPRLGEPLANDIFGIPLDMLQPRPLKKRTCFMYSRNSH